MFVTISVSRRNTVPSHLPSIADEGVAGNMSPPHGATAAPTQRGSPSQRIQPYMTQRALRHQNEAAMQWIRRGRTHTCPDILATTDLDRYTSGLLRVLFDHLLVVVCHWTCASRLSTDTMRPCAGSDLAVRPVSADMTSQPRYQNTQELKQQFLKAALVTPIPEPPSSKHTVTDVSLLALSSECDIRYRKYKPKNYFSTRLRLTCFNG